MNQYLDNPSRTIFRTHRSGGFVLVVVLILILLAGFSLAVVARTSFSTALDAKHAITDLQTRWAVHTANDHFLPGAKNVLQSIEKQSGAPTASRRLKLKLGEIDFTFILSDESAKLNLNQVLRKTKTDGANRALRDILSRCSSNSGGTFGIRLRPYPIDIRRNASTDLLLAFDQVFDTRSPAELPKVLMSPEVGSRSVCDYLTLYSGGGRVNFRRADESVIRLAAGSTVDSSIIETLLTARRQNPMASLSSAMSKAQLNDQQRRSVMSVLTDQSSAQSLWVIADTPSSRPRYFLTVRGTFAGRTDNRIQFNW